MKPEPPPDAPLVSVVIPCFNYGRFLLEAIDSVLASTFTSLEIIVVDDGSTDPETLRLLDGLDRPRTRVVRQVNKRLPAARNTGFREARGKYVLPLDADDRIAPTLIEKAYWVLEHRPRLGFVSFWLQHFGDENWVWKPEPYNLFRLLHANSVTVTSLVRRDAWAAAGGYDETLVHGYEDWEFWIRLGANGWHGFQVPEPLFLYRKHGASMITAAESRHQELVTAIRRRHPWLYSRIGLGLLRRHWEEGLDPSRWLDGVRRQSLGVLRRAGGKLAQALGLRGLAKRIRKPNDPVAPVPWLQDTSAFAEKTLPRVMCLFPWLDMGGADRVHLDLVASLINQGMAVTVVTTLVGEDPWLSRFTSVGAEVYRLGILGFDEPVQLALLRHLVVARGIDVVWVGNSDIGFASLRHLKAAKPRLATVALIHNHVPESPRDFVRQAVAQSEYLDEIVSVSETLRRAIQDKVGRDGPIATCVPNGTDLGKFRAVSGLERTRGRELLGLPAEVPVVGFVGRLSPEKGCLHFIHAAIALAGRSSSQPIQFVVAGDGPESVMLRAIAGQAGLGDRILFLGSVDRVWELLPLLDLLVAPSEFEGLPLIGLEAMASGVPVLATRVRGWQEIIRHGETGWLLGTDELSRLPEVVLSALDAEDRHAITIRARQYVLEHHDGAASSKGYLDVVRRVMESLRERSEKNPALSQEVAYFV